MDNVKQVIIVRKDLNMRKGKLASQVAHASMKVLLDNMIRGVDLDGEDTRISDMLIYDHNSPLDIWLSGSFTKIVVFVESEKDLVDAYNSAKKSGILCSLIEDEGRTEFNGIPTKTAVAIGPDFSENIDPITKGMKLL